MDALIAWQLCSTFAWSIPSQMFYVRSSGICWTTGFIIMGFSVDFTSLCSCCRYESIERRKPSSSSHNEVFLATPGPKTPTVTQVRSYRDISALYCMHSEQNLSETIYKVLGNSGLMTPASRAVRSGQGLG